MRAARAAALAAIALAAAGCGTASPDLFEVARSGADRNANVRLRVSDAGTVTCNDRTHRLDSERLLAARGVARDLAEHAALGIELPPRPGSVLRYRVRMESGSLAFADNSPSRPPAFDRLVALTADLTRRVCGIER